MALDDQHKTDPKNLQSASSVPRSPLVDGSAKLNSHADPNHPKSYGPKLDTSYHREYFGDEDEPWLLNKINIIVGAVSVLLLLIAFGLHMSNMKHLQTVVAQNKVISKKKAQLDKLQARNDRVIYLPKAGDVNITPEQEKSIQFLNSFFTRITTYRGQTAYDTNYRFAKQAGIKDKRFFDSYLNQPYSHGIGIVKASNVLMDNVRTQVIVTGKDSYTVLVTYIPYHNSSDLYQRKSLKTLTNVFDVQGKPGNWTKMQPISDIKPLNTEMLVNDLEQ